MKKIKDKDIISAIVDNDHKAINAAMNQLYEDVYPFVKGYITKNSGTVEDSHDIFQDAIVVFFIKIRKGEYIFQSNLKTYLMGISRNLWLKHLRKGRIADNYSSSVEQNHFIEEVNIYNRQVTIEKVLELINKECKELLIDFYFKSRTTKELMAKFSLGSEAATKNKKYRCMQRLISLIKQRGLNKADFSYE